MIANKPVIQTKDLRWLDSPKNNHIVQFYLSEHELMSPLSQFIKNGIDKNETCIVAATKPHLQDLNNILKANGIDVSRALANKKLIEFDAHTVLGKILINGLPDESLFRTFIGNTLDKLNEDQQPVRIYGELVAVLWKDGNKEAVQLLENYWNNLALNYKFSLYCAYPSLHFLYDKQELNKIKNSHSEVMFTRHAC